MNGDNVLIVFLFTCSHFVTCEFCVSTTVMILNSPNTRTLGVPFHNHIPPPFCVPCHP